MSRYNVLAAVVEVIEAGTEQAAITELNDRLRAAGFEPYEGTHDLMPDGYKLAYEIEDGS